MDVLTVEQRRKNMAAIRGKDSTPERKVRSMLHRLGLRFRLHDRRLPGKPDIVLPRFHSVVFVHGCFWHRHPGCRFATMPATREDFWRKKFAENVERDRRAQRDLRKDGWKVIVIWECETRNIDFLVGRARRLQNAKRHKEA